MQQKKLPTALDRLWSFLRKSRGQLRQLVHLLRHRGQQVAQNLKLLLKGDKETWLHIYRNYIGFSRTTSGGNTTASTIWLIISGVMLYFENILGIFFDLSVAVPQFIRLDNFIYATETAVSAIIILFASRLNPYKLAYIVPLYAWVNVLIGNTIMALGFKIWEFWWYRLLIFGTALPVYIILINTIRQQEARERSEQARQRLLNNYRKQHDE